MNTKGLVNYGIAVAVVAIVILSSVFLLTGVLGVGEATNLDQDSSCKPKDFRYEVTGNLRIVDGAIFTIEPEIDSFQGVGSRPLAAFEPFDYTVELFDVETGDSISTYKGSSDLSSAVKSKNVPFSLPFKVKDCDGLFSAQLRLKATLLETKDIIADESRKEVDLTIRDNKVS